MNMLVFKGLVFFGVVKVLVKGVGDVFIDVDCYVSKDVLCGWKGLVCCCCFNGWWSLLFYVRCFECKVIRIG